MGRNLTGFYPFWFWNDRLDENEVRRQIREMAAQGVKGFYIHSRQGLQQPYLSEAFFHMVDAAVDEAKKHGLTVHLYDEYPYPSGIAGGEVVLGSPEYYGTHLVSRSYLVDGGRVELVLPAGKVLAAKAYPVVDGMPNFDAEIDLIDQIGMVLTEDSYVETGLTSYNRKRYFASEPRPVLEAELPNAQFKIYVSLQCQIAKHKYWDKFVDPMNPEAVAAFIKLTHERYRKRYQAEFGKTILGIFTDEVAPAWSRFVPEAFYKKYGYELRDKLTALQAVEHPEHRKVKYDYNQLIFEMFCQSFEEPVSNWCRENGIYYSGEKPSLRLSQLKYMDIPGSDNGHKKAGSGLDIFQPRIRTNARAVTSAVYFYDKPIGLCECYHSLGWSGTLQDAKIIAEGLLLAGVEHLVPHGFFYSTHGLKKHDAPPSFFFQMPYWPLFKHLSQRVAALSDQFKDTYIDANVLVYAPHSGVPTREQLSEFSRLLHLLADQHIDFHIADTDILTEGEIKNGRLLVKDLAVELVIIPPMEYMEAELKAWIEKYQAAGGNILYYHQNHEQEFTAQLTQLVRPSLSISLEGKELAGVYAVKRVNKTDPNQVFWFILNTTDQEVVVDLDAGCALEEISLGTDLPHRLYQDLGGYKRLLKPYESFIAAAAGGENTTEWKNSPTVLSVKIDRTHKLKYTLKNKNLLRMNEWEMTLIGEDGEAETKTVTAAPLANQLAAGGFKFTPKTKTYFGHIPELDYPELKVNYQYQFELKCSAGVELVMEPGSIGGEWTISVNDQAALTAADFGPTDAHVYGSIGVDITSMLKPGINTIKVDVEASKSNHGLLNCLYLAGSFGVELDPPALVELSEQGLFDDYIANKIPYYAGVIEYEGEFTLADVPQSEAIYLELDFGREFNEAYEAAINGGEYQPVLWQPRVIKTAAENLVQGRNQIAVRLYTTLIRSFEGSWFDEKAHRYREVGELE